MALKALILTIVIEYIIYLIILRRNPLRLFLYALLINGFTQPLAYYLFGVLTADILPENYNHFNIYFVLIEVSVIIVESFLILLLMKLSYIKSFTISVIANLITASLSFVNF